MEERVKTFMILTGFLGFYLYISGVTFLAMFGMFFSSNPLIGLFFLFVGLSILISCPAYLFDAKKMFEKGNYVQAKKVVLFPLIPISLFYAFWFTLKYL